jgi:hypothetical protein
MYLSALNLKSVLPAHLAFHLSHPAALKLDYLATAQAHQMIVLPRRPFLIMMVLLLEVELMDEAQSLEEAQAPVYCGQAQAGIFLLSQSEELMGIQMPSPAPDELQEQSPLRGDPLLVLPQDPAGNGLGPEFHDVLCLALMQIVCITG